MEMMVGFLCISLGEGRGGDTNALKWTQGESRLSLWLSDLNNRDRPDEKNLYWPETKVLGNVIEANEMHSPIGGVADAL